MTDKTLIPIASEQLQAAIDSQGAQLFDLRDAQGRDLLWNGDPGVWKGRAPILFPIVGALAGNQYTLDGEVFSLPRHGFARDRLFTVVESNPGSALFRLTWDAESFRVYPFQFELDLRFTLTGATLEVAATVRNLELDKTLPASFGFHPALRWPLPYGEARAAHFLAFEKDEPSPVRRLDGDGLVMPEIFPTPVEGRKLSLRDDLFTADAIIFDAMESRKVRYGAEKGPGIAVAFPAMPQLGVWSKPGAGFICIEPWHGYADPQGYGGDFRAKPGIVLIAPAAAETFAMTISLQP